MNKKGNKIIKKILFVLSYVFLAFLFLLACFLVFYITTNAIAKKKGTNPLISMYTIASPSMEPYIKVYDVIVDVRVKSEQDLSIGDVITFYSNTIDTGGFTITHRIFNVYEADGVIHYITKGDNNQAQDAGNIKFSNIVGKYLFKIPGLGRVQFFVSSTLGWILIILLPALYIILTDIIKIVKAYKIKKQVEDIPKIKNVDKKHEIARDKKVRALIEKANSMNNEESPKK